ncbi:AAA family ATPase [Aggregatibacter actinomycetemcomitans]|uniref:AAA family ATPase n=1 Tax=Aggregatibacter actinomycetemcomitans TaxID=714 RepID=UPI00197C653D|nr:AAA family ATPase [Aggregatibacter actinomycetemcomitans]MBN6075397.1 AAA family ATPase [Aggregatibacter actinomycetemcomitans]
MKNENIVAYREWDGESKPSTELMKFISDNPFELIEVVVSNYKAFSDRVSVKFESNLSSIVFVGVNASGKTTIAESIAKSLSKINSAIYNRNNDSGDMIDENNINKKNGEYQSALIELNLGYKNDKLTKVILAKSPVGAPKNVNSTLIEAKKLGVMYSYMLTEKDLDLPLYLFYGVDRSSLKSRDKFEKLEIYYNVDRLSAIPQKLTTKLNFDDFLLWFKYLDDNNNQDIVNIFEVIKDELNDLDGKANELEKYNDKNMLEGINIASELLRKMNIINTLYSKLENNKVYSENSTEKGKQLEKVKETIIDFIPNIKDIKVDRNQPYPFIAEKRDGSKFLLSELSQGEKSIISLVGDLARRMLILNPHKNNPLETPAIVIIDELELHLHPHWQEEVIYKLEKNFPKTKFILTTHTPTIVSSIINDNLYLISDNKIIQIKHQGTYGAEYSRIYADLYNISSRPNNSITKKLYRYLDMIDRDEYDSEEAIILRKELDKHFKNNEPALDEATLIIENKKWEKSLYEKSK